jgi:hypothetical protein
MTGRIGFEGPLSPDCPLYVGLRYVILPGERVTEDCEISAVKKVQDSQVCPACAPTLRSRL